MATKRNTRTTKTQKRGTLPWGVMLLSFIVGAFAMFLIHLNNNVDSNSKPPVAAKAAKKASPSKPTRIEPTFDFYSVLPETETVVNRSESKKRIVSAPASKPKPNTAVANKPVHDEQNYLLQVGSFRNSADADAYKAKLAFLGIESKVQKVTIDNKDTWHRVQVGPIKGREKADALQQKLKKNKMDSLLMRTNHG